MTATRNLHLPDNVDSVLILENQHIDDSEGSEALLLQLLGGLQAGGLVRELPLVAAWECFGHDLIIRITA